MGMRREGTNESNKIIVIFNDPRYNLLESSFITIPNVLLKIDKF
jgi:hypothetical protein